MRQLFCSLLVVFAFAQVAFGQAKVMNPGEAIGQLVILSVKDVLDETPKYKSLSPLSIPVFAELPLDMSVVAGAVTLKQQNLLSHVQLKSRARHTPNLDISALPGGVANPLFAPYADGAWIRMVLTVDGQVTLEDSTQALAIAFYESKMKAPVTLKSDLTVSTILRTEDLSSKDAIIVGSKSANYGELAKLLNTADRTIVRPGMGIPFYYYQQFVDSNPNIKAAIESILRDPLMGKVAKVTYREAKLKALQEMMISETAIVDDKLVADLITRFDQFRANGLPRNIKLRSSTNSEDLPNFNGAGLYDSISYKPTKDGKEKSTEKKIKSLKEALQGVWASVWNLRAYDERNYFRIPHSQVKMGIQVNPTFGGEIADGVVVTKNVAREAGGSDLGVYIETQRGDKHSVANPEANVKPQKVLVIYDEAQPLNTALYQIQVLQHSNIADDNETILSHDNPNPVMNDAEITDLTLQVLKAQIHFGPVLDPQNKKFALDLEFKVDKEDTGTRQIYIKQARPYID